MEKEYKNEKDDGDLSNSGMNTGGREPVVVAEQPACPVEEKPREPERGDRTENEDSQGGRWSSPAGTGSGDEGWRSSADGLTQGEDWGRPVSGREQYEGQRSQGEEAAQDSFSKGGGSMAGREPGCRNQDGSRVQHDAQSQTQTQPQPQTQTQTQTQSQPQTQPQTQSQLQSQSQHNTQYQTQYNTQYQTPAPEKNNMSIAALVMGILSLVSCCCTWIGIVFGVLGIIFSLMSKTDGQMDGQAKAGLVMSITGIVLDILIIILFVALQVFALIPEL